MPEAARHGADARWNPRVLRCRRPRAAQARRARGARRRPARLLGAPDAALPETVRSRLEELRQLEKRLRAAEDELATAIAATLAGQAENVVEAHLEGRDLPFLQQLGRKVATAAPRKAVFLTATAGAEHCFVVAAGAQAGVDVQAVGRQIATALGGRGGGSGLLAQGKAPSLAGRAAALEALRSAAGTG